MAGIKNHKSTELKEVNGITYRKCTCCNEFKTLDEFYSNCKNKAYWIDSVCKICRRKKSLQRQKEKHDEILMKKREKKLKERGIQPPFNYMGNKYLLLPQIKPLLPDKINTAVDLFCGSTTVGINLNADKIVCNDRNSDMINFYNICKKLNAEQIIGKIKETINNYNLSRENDEPFFKLRNDFNTGNKQWNIFYTLVTYSYNQNPTYNKNGDYMTGFGRKLCWFNPSLEKRMKEFIDKIKKINIDFTSFDFRKFNYDILKCDDFIYVDPPYLISSKTYEWTKQDEIDLLNILDELDKRGVKFALSNVLKHKKGINMLLFNWSKKYNIYRMQRNYMRINKGREKDTYSTEVLITNYN